MAQNHLWFRGGLWPPFDGRLNCRRSKTASKPIPYLGVPCL